MVSTGNLELNSSRNSLKLSKISPAIFWDNFGILLEVFIPNTLRNNCVTYTNL